MGPFKKFTFLAVLALAYSLAYADLEHQKIQFLIAKKEYHLAIKNYLSYVEKAKEHDHELLISLANSLIDNAVASSDSKQQMLGLYGLLISDTFDPSADFSRLLQSSDPYVQLLTLQYLASKHDDYIDSLLNRAMGSNFLPVRMLALNILVANKSKMALSHIESLYYRLPDGFRPYFAEYYAALGTPHALSILRGFLTDPNPEVKIAALLSIEKHHRDDFIPSVKKMLSQPDIQLQETATYVLSKLSDQSSLPSFHAFLSSNNDNLKLASALGCLEFNDFSGVESIQSLAKQGDLFAILALGRIEHTEKALAECARIANYDVRLNALLALLEKKDPKAKSIFKDFLSYFSQNDAIAPIFSIGKTCSAFKIQPSYRKQFQKMPEYVEWLSAMTHLLREQMLIQALELPEKDFLEIAEHIFTHDQFDLIPTLVHLLENLRSEETIEMLKRMSNRVGSPMIRSYALIALARMRAPGYENIFLDWIKEQSLEQLIQIKPVDTKESLSKSSSRYQLTPDENSALLLEAFSTLVQIHDERTLPIFLKAIAEGPAHNQAVLAGLLLKAVQ